MDFSPCPWGPLGTIVKLLAVFDIILGVLFVCMLIASLVLVSMPHMYHPNVYDVNVILIVTLAFFLFLTLFEIGMAMLLFSGANNRSTKKCNVWLVLTGIIVGLVILGIISQIYKRRPGSEFIWVSIYIPFKIYEWLVVYSFVQHVNAGDKGDGFVHPTSDTRLLEPGHPRYTPLPTPQ